MIPHVIPENSAWMWQIAELADFKDNDFTRASRIILNKFRSKLHKSVHYRRDVFKKSGAEKIDCQKLQYYADHLPHANTMVVLQQSNHTVLCKLSKEEYVATFDKVITTSTMVITALDLWSLICNPSVWGTWRSGMGLFGSPPIISSPLTHIHMVCYLLFSSYLASIKSTSACPTRIRWRIAL